MGRYVTPAGVVIEMADKAAVAVGYRAETPVEVAPVSEEKSSEVKRGPGRPKKLDLDK